MAAQLISGKTIAAEIREELTNECLCLKEQGIVPGLGIIIVGDDDASLSYVRSKEKACQKTGIHCDGNGIPSSTSQDELIVMIKRMNVDPTIHGILVQLPLPEHIDESIILTSIDPSKDVDGFHPVNVGRMVTGKRSFLPCTPHGIVQLLVRSNVEIAGSHVVVVGRSDLVGKPVANMLLQKKQNANATVTICHSTTRDLAYHTQHADILIVATGNPNTITADMVKDGVVVIDVGINRVPDSSTERGYRITGDVDFAAVSEKASLITPVPGGVGPMTIAMLLYNTIEGAKIANGMA